MRRWTTSARPLSKRMTMYFPRRSTAATRSPSSSASTSAGSSGSVRRGSWMRTRESVRPTRRGSSRARYVSTSGSSGRQVDVEHERTCSGRRVADLVRREHLVDGCRGGASSRACTSASTSPPRRVAALAHGRRRRWRGRSRRPSPPPGSEMQCRHARSWSRRAERRGRPRSGDLSDDRCDGECLLARVASLRCDPTLQTASARAVCDRMLARAATLRLVDLEIRQRQQVCARVERRARSSPGGPRRARVKRLADLERVADGKAERLVHVREHTDRSRDPHAGRARASSPRGRVRCRASS